MCEEKKETEDRSIIVGGCREYSELYINVLVVVEGGLLRREEGRVNKATGKEIPCWKRDLSVAAGWWSMKLGIEHGIDLGCPHFRADIFRWQIIRSLRRLTEHFEFLSTNLLEYTREA